MVVVLSASLPQDGVCFAGEKFVCVLTFTNSVQQPDSSSSSHQFPRHPEQTNDGHHYKQSFLPDRKSGSLKRNTRPNSRQILPFPTDHSASTVPANGFGELHTAQDQKYFESQVIEKTNALAIRSGSPINSSQERSVKISTPTGATEQSSALPDHYTASAPLFISTARQDADYKRLHSARSLDTSVGNPSKNMAASPVTLNDRPASITESGIGSAFRLIAGTLFGTGLNADSAATKPSVALESKLDNHPENTYQYEQETEMLQRQRQRQASEQLEDLDSLATSHYTFKNILNMRGEAIPEGISRETSFTRLPHSVSQTSDFASPGVVEYLSPVFSPVSAQSSDTIQGPWQRGQTNATNSVVGSRRNSFSNLASPIDESVTKNELDENGQVSELGGKLQLYSSKTNIHQPNPSRRQSHIHSHSVDDLEFASPRLQDEMIRMGSTINHGSTLSPISDRSTHFEGSTVPAILPHLKTASMQMKRCNTEPTRVAGVNEDIAWAFAQMTGEFTVDTTYVKTSLFNSLRQKVMYRAAGSPSGHGSQGGGGSLGISASTPTTVNRNETQPLPLYSTPPSILFCDMSLAPGESKSYKYEIFIPSVLPPSHRGKVIRFNYKLIVGIQRSGKIRQSQIISIPFRLFNRTNSDGTRPIYEIMNPVIINKDESVVTPLQTWSKLAVFAPLTPEVPMSAFYQPESSRATSLTDFEEYTTSMNNIMCVCQTSKKVSYDICKNNEHVAQLTLSRISYRLGETITIIFNFSNGSIPCLQASVFLESVETVDPTFSLKQKHSTVAYTRRCHAELHRSTLNSRRLVLSVAIPPTATADFQTTAVSMQWSLRLEFVTGVAGQLQRNHFALDEGFQHYHGAERVEVEPFDCMIPLKLFGGMRALKRTNKTYTFT
ncbi:Golgi membrane exchange factor (Ric1p-Rgp1p) subunit [Batrachochytrium dendrobatidis]|nr:Golgi membrane exchange factor (Ric1p-Rgp1p) subunit [Batrachochytrium dendrobatidis]